MNTFDAWNEMEKERKQRKENAPCSEWISVKERLPEIGKNVLVCFKNGKMAVAYVFSTDKGFTLWRTTDGCWTCKCGHWMPLPEPPEEGGGDDG